MTPSPSGTGWTANEKIKCKWQERFSDLDHPLYIKNSIIKKRSKLDFEQNKEWWLATYQRCQRPPLSEFPQPPSPLPIGQKQTAQKHNPNTKNRTAVIRDFLTYGNSKRFSISAHIYTFIKHIHKNTFIHQKGSARTAAQPGGSSGYVSRSGATSLGDQTTKITAGGKCIHPRPAAHLRAHLGTHHLWLGFP